jgi:hypothetical protein
MVEEWRCVHRTPFKAFFLPFEHKTGLFPTVAGTCCAPTPPPPPTRLTALPPCLEVPERNSMDRGQAHTVIQTSPAQTNRSRFLPFQPEPLVAENRFRLAFHFERLILLSRDSMRLGTLHVAYSAFSLRNQVLRMRRLDGTVDFFKTQVVPPSSAGASTHQKPWITASQVRQIKQVNRSCTCFFFPQNVPATSDRRKGSFLPATLYTQMHHPPQRNTDRRSCRPAGLAGCNIQGTGSGHLLPERAWHSVNTLHTTVLQHIVTINFKQT